MLGRLSLFRTGMLVVIPALTASAPPDDPGKVFAGYAREELQYFQEVAFRNDRLYRWQRAIEISSTGDDPALEAVVTEVIREIRPLLGRLPVARADTGNLVIHYPATVSGYASRYTEPGPLPLGYTVPQFSGTELVRADIFIHPLLVPEKKSQVLRHEICHALGLLEHASTLYPEPGLLTPASVRPAKAASAFNLLSRLDRAAIRLLYDPRVRPGFSRRDFRRKTGL